MWQSYCLDDIILRDKWVRGREYIENQLLLNIVGAAGKKKNSMFFQLQFQVKFENFLLAVLKENLFIP